MFTFSVCKRCYFSLSLSVLRCSVGCVRSCENIELQRLNERTCRTFFPSFLSSFISSVYFSHSCACVHHSLSHFSFFNVTANLKFGDVTKSYPCNIFTKDVTYILDELMSFLLPECPAWDCNLCVIVYYRCTAVFLSLYGALGVLWAH